MNTKPIVAYIRQHIPDVLAIYLYGSQARHQANSDSDIDIGILVPTYIDIHLLWNMMGEVSQMMDCHVDLVDLRAASTVMQYQIVTGKRLWEKGMHGRMFEMFIYNEKLALDERRKLLLEDIESKGRIYGR